MKIYKQSFFCVCLLFLGTSSQAQSNFSISTNVGEARPIDANGYFTQNIVWEAVYGANIMWDKKMSDKFTLRLGLGYLNDAYTLVYNPLEAPGNRTINDRTTVTMRSIVLPIEVVYAFGKWRPILGLNMQRYLKATDYNTRGGASFREESNYAPLLIAGIKGAVTYQLMQTENASLQAGPYVMYNYNFTDIKPLHVGLSAIYSFKLKERNRE